MAHFRALDRARRIGLLGFLGFVAVEASARELSAIVSSQQVVIEERAGPAANHTPGSSARVVYSAQVRIPGASWLRLAFSEVSLSGDAATGTKSYLRIRSVRDGGTQTLDSRALAQWQNHSAYFNGDAVVVELLAHPGTGENNLNISLATAGVGALGMAHPDGCPAQDDRGLSQDPRVGRLLPPASEGPCTAWLIDDFYKGFLSAGHCDLRRNLVVQFNVPLSNPDGTLNHPGPEDQYAVDRASARFSFAGPDYAYFGCFPNSETGKTPFEAQGAYYRLASEAPGSRKTIRMTGYGAVSGPVDLTWNGVQKTNLGDYLSETGYVIGFSNYVTHGDSGSAVFDEEADEAFGILAFYVCNKGTDIQISYGTALDHPTVQAALASPRGILVPSLEFCYADCNRDGVLNGRDFVCFRQRFRAGDPWANCDGNINTDYSLRFDAEDFRCFREKLRLGCPE